MLKVIGVYVILGAVLLTAVFLVTIAVRSFNRAATGVSVVEPEDGVRCALATSADGVAIDCWQVPASR